MMNYEELEELGFDFKQINQILKAEALGYDFSKLSVHISAQVMRKIIELNPNFVDTERIRLLANCIKNNFDTSYALDTETFNNKQAAEIIDAMYKKVNYKLIANPDWTSAQMKSAKRALIAGVDEELIQHLKPSQFKKYQDLVIKAKKIKFNVKEAFLSGYNISQISTLMNLKGYDIDVSQYVTPKHDSYQISEISKMVRFLKIQNVDLDIKKATNHMFTPKAMRMLFDLVVEKKEIEELYSGKYSTSQINVIGSAAKQNLDYKILLNPDFSAEQMNMILCGLQAGLDVKIYAKPELQPSVMKLIFDNLKYNKNNPGIEIEVELLANPKLKYQEITHYAKVLKSGTLDEKLEVLKKLNDLMPLQKKNIEKEEVNLDNK